MKSFRSLFPRGPGSEFAAICDREMIGEWSGNVGGMIGNDQLIYNKDLNEM